MNQLEEMREQCANVAQQYANNAYNNSSQNAAMEIRDAIRALPLPEVNQKPDAWLCTDLDGHFGFGFDKKLAKQNAGYDCDEFYPLYFLAPDAESLRKENEQLRRLLGEFDEIMAASCDWPDTLEEQTGLQKLVLKVRKFMGGGAS